MEDESIYYCQPLPGHTDQEVAAALSAAGATDIFAKDPNDPEDDLVPGYVQCRASERVLLSLGWLLRFTLLK